MGTDPKVVVVMPAYNAGRTLRMTYMEVAREYRAFRREVLETVNFRLNSDGFVFDQEIIAQVVAAGRLRIAEIAVPTRYFPEASSASFRASTVYGVRILSLLARDALHAKGVWRSRRFDSLRGRYSRLAAAPHAAAGAAGAVVLARPRGARPG